MVTLSIHLGVAVFHLTFVNMQGAVTAKNKYLSAKKDDPVGDLELTDDYAETIIFKPSEVKLAFIIDKDRESEILVQQKLLEVRRTIEQTKRVQGSPDIMAAAKSMPQMLAPGGNA